MRSFAFPLSVDESRTNGPLFVRISEAIARDILRGRLRPGDALPGTRTLAKTLGVHRTTVIAAYAELGAQGFTETKPGGATYVAAGRVEVPARGFAAHASLRSRVPDRPGFTVERSAFPKSALPTLPPGTLALWGGVPDARLVPTDLLSRAYRRAAKHKGRELLGYTSDPQGHPRLRAALSALVCMARGLAATPDTVLVTRGSQMALDLVARSLFRPGDAVAVEALGYARAFRVFERAGARLLPIAVDRHGIDVEALAKLARDVPIRAVYVTPHHQYPTTVVLSPSRRLALLDLACRQRMAVIEDDYDQEFHYDGRPVLPLASADSHGNVVYIGTLAKILAPGLRLGFVVAPPLLLSRMNDERALIDRQGDSLLEYAVAELFEDGEIQRHVRRARRIYHARRDALCRALDARLSNALSYRKPAGGLAVWATVSPDLDVDVWLDRSMRAGVHFQIGRQFTLDGSPVHAVRLGYAMLDEREIATAVRRMQTALARRSA